jgi:hypothetical protein
VAKYRNNKISTLLYPNFIYQFAKLYNNAYVLVESNDVGKQVADILYHDLEYEFMFFTATDPKTGQHISAGYKGNAVLGVKTSRAVKRIGCSNFKTMVESNKFAVVDIDLLNELFRFSAKGDSYEAEEGNDDLVMCSVLFSWLIQQPYVKELTSTDIRSSLHADNESAIEESLLPFGIVDDGMDVHEYQPVVAVAAGDGNWLWN